jgi:hypothetical protein
MIIYRRFCLIIVAIIFPAGCANQQSSMLAPVEFGSGQSETFVGD